MEVRCLEAFAEATVDWFQNLARLRNAMLIPPQVREAGGGSQFPGESLLPASPVESLKEVPFGRGRGIGSVLQNDELALGSQQLGKAPMLLSLR